MPRYRPWSYANREEVRQMRSRTFRQNADVYDAEARAAPAERPSTYYGEVAARKVDGSLPLAQAAPKAEKKGGGGIFGKVKKAAGNVAGDVGGAALDVGKSAGGKLLQALDVPGDYTLRPFQGAATMLGAERVYDEKTGEYYRKKPSLRDLGQGVKELATQSPIESYREGKQAREERLRDPN
ncbi:MAG: hypothetical protein H0U59_10900, partial [Gemmatimonadaceae bacterium]|nr:hypothetical protein [Gemmatimonadaceae bacterium]